MNITIETERFTFREIDMQDIDDLYEVDGDPEVMKYLGGVTLENRDQIIPIIENIRKQYVDNGLGRWAIIDKLSGDMLGWGGLKYETSLSEMGPYYDLGYRLKRQHWGKGIASENAFASLRYGFEVLKLDKINAGAHIDNLASNRILQKIGMTQGARFNWGADPHNWYEITREEYLKHHI